MSIVISIIAILVMFSVIVFFHELGHYWAARKSGVTVEVFSIGFGPEVIGFNDKHATRWKFSAIPLGGYVKMAGDTDAASTPAQGSAEIEGSFQAASLKAKAFIVVMGPIASFLLGIFIIMGVYIGFGKITAPTVVADVQQGSAAETAGLEIGDEILTVNGYRVHDFSALKTFIYESPGRPLLLTVDRRGREIELDIIPDTVEDKCMMATYGRIGVVSERGELKRMGPIEALATASVDSFTMAFAMLRGIGRLASGNANKGEIGGPVKIAEISGRVAQQGLIPFALLIAVISINLGLVNLLPIPPLDGGHLLFFGLEGLMGKPVPPKLQELVMRAGMALLLTLIVVVTLFDGANTINAQC